MAKAKAYEQLDAETRELLAAAAQKLGSIKAAAEQLGYSRPSVSAALAGKYKGGTLNLRRAIREKFCARRICPYLGREISAAECRQYYDRRCPTSSRDEVKHWQACQNCRFNPRAEPEQETENGENGA